MNKATIIIPKKDNNGNKFPTAVIAQIQKDILKEYGGYTVRNVKGAWLGPDGKTYMDDSWEYSIVMDDEGVKKIENRLIKIKELLRQEAMYLEVQKIKINYI